MSDLDEILAQFYRDRGFYKRDGPGKARDPDDYCHKKLCFTSTSVDPMARLLYVLSQRDDCFWVKLDEAPGRHGMVRGRAFMTTEDAVVALWKEHKVTDRVLCTIQDDDFTVDHR